jgi:hypothetical protein
MSTRSDAYDPSVGAGRRHLPSSAGEECDHDRHHATDCVRRERADAISGFL